MQQCRKHQPGIRDLALRRRTAQRQRFEPSVKEGFVLLAQGWLALADQVDWVERRCGQILQQGEHDSPSEKESG